MVSLFIITLIIALSVILSGYLIKRDPSLLTGNEKGLNSNIVVKDFYTTGLVIIILGIILFLWGTPFSLILLMIVSIPTFIIYVNIKPVNNKLKKSNMIIIILSILFTLSIITFLCISSKEPSISFENNNIKISGLYGETIPVETIREISLTENLPTIIYRSNGLSLGEINKGYFKTKESGSVKLFLQKSKGPFIHITNNKGKHYYINFKDSSKTNDSYLLLKNALNKLPNGTLTISDYVITKENLLISEAQTSRAKMSCCIGYL